MSQQKETRRSKEYQIRLSDSAKPHRLPPKDWYYLVDSGIARIETKTDVACVARLRLPFIGTIVGGKFRLSKIGASIQSTWVAWEREWFFRMETISEKERQERASETLEQRTARVYRERDSQLFIEALDWKTNRQKGNRNRLRWVSREELERVLTAFGRMPAANNAA